METGEKQRKLQREQDSKDKAQAKQGKQEKPKKAVQAGPQKEPEPPLPDQHLVKPGIEAQMELKPRFLAPDYRGSGKLKGMVALITGGEIGRAHV